MASKYADHLTRKETEYLTNFEYEFSIRYGFPDVHKCNEIINNVQNNLNEFVVENCPTSLTMRPIIAGPQCVTSRLNNFIDKILQPLLMQVDRCIRDGIDFSTKMPRFANKCKSLASFEISKHVHDYQ